MKRAISLLLAAVLGISMLAGCGAKEADPVAVNVGAMKGPTAMGMVKICLLYTSWIWYPAMISLKFAVQASQASNGALQNKKVTKEKTGKTRKKRRRYE